MTDDYIRELRDSFQPFTEKTLDEQALVGAIQFWFYSLPKYTKLTTKAYQGNGQFICLDNRLLKLKNQLRSPEIDTNKFLFEKLPAIFEETDLLTVAGLVKKAMREIDDTLPLMLEALKNDVCVTFNCHNKAIIWETLTGWYEMSPECAKHHCFDNGEERIFKAITQGNKSIPALCVMLTGLAPENFEEDTPATFLKRLHEHKSVVESYGITQNSNLDNTYSILLGGHSVKTFNKAQSISNIGGVLMNELTSVVSEYGQAVGLNEKRQILLNVLNGLGELPTDRRQHDLH